MDLVQVFDRLNAAHFDGFLDPPELSWNSRLRSSAGRFIPGSRRPTELRRPVIEIATGLLAEAGAAGLVADTMGHEMIHYWLWVRRRPYGHTPEFRAKMIEMGVSRYSQAPRSRPFRYLYSCMNCAKGFPARRLLGKLACADCCARFASGRYDARFELRLQRKLSPAEGAQLVGEQGASGSA